MRAFDHGLYDGRPYDSFQRLSIRATNATATTDNEYGEITDGCTGESVASSDSRSNSIVRIGKSRSQGSAFSNLGVHV